MAYNVLIGFVGTSNYEQQAKFRYINRTKKTHFPMCSIVQNALKTSQIDYTLILSTDNKKALKNASTLKEDIKSISDIRVEILKVSMANNEKAINDMYLAIDNKVGKIVKKNKDKQIEITIDMTNGYRTQPFVLYLLINFLKRKYNNVNINNVYYGLVDNPKDVNSDSRMVSLSKQNHLVDWAYGIDMFLKTGETASLLEIVKTDHCKKQERDLVEKIDEFSRAMKVCRMEEVEKDVGDVLKAINKIKTINGKDDYYSLLYSVLDPISKKFQEFKEGKYYAAIDWHMQNGNIQQALTVCTEYFLVLLLEKEIVFKKPKDSNKKEIGSCYNGLKDFVNKAILDDSVLKQHNKVLMEESNLYHFYKKIEEYVNSLNMEKIRLIVASKKHYSNFLDHVYELSDGADQLYLFKRDKTEPVYQLDNCKEIGSTIALQLLLEKIDSEYKNHYDEDIFQKHSLKEVIDKANLTQGKFTGLTNKKLFKEIYDNYANQYRTTKYQIKVGDYDVVYPPQIKKKVFDALKTCKELPIRYSFNSNEISNYYLKNKTEIIKSIEEYRVLRRYRNDINHAGSKLTRAIEQNENKIFLLEDFYSDESNLKTSMNSIQEYMKKFEKGK